MVSKLSYKLDTVMCNDGSNAPSVEISSSSNGFRVEKVREFPAFVFRESPKILVLRSSFVDTFNFG